MSSVVCFDLDQSKILLFGNGLMDYKFPRTDIQARGSRNTDHCFNLVYTISQVLTKNTGAETREKAWLCAGTIVMLPK